MILLKISNASELVADKLGQLVERLTPDAVDHATVEDLVIKRMIETLTKEGLKGEISSVRGVDLNNEQFVVNQGLKIRSHETF